jgi:hypothetical protein
LISGKAMVGTKTAKDQSRQTILTSGLVAAHSHS